jgi:DNA-binding transcriptional ArsR family regulator
MTAVQDDVSAAAVLFRGLGDPTRLTILRHLALGEHRVVDLTAHLGLAQSTVSGHLACLRDCGLVAVRPEGRSTRWSLARPELLEVLDAAERLAGRLGPRGRPLPHDGGVVVTAHLSEGLAPAEAGAPGPSRAAVRPASAWSTTASRRHRARSRRRRVLRGARRLRLDSLVEVSSGLVILWQFRGASGRRASGRRSAPSPCRSWRWRRTSPSTPRARLLTGAQPDASVVGIVLASVSLAVMPFLSLAQRRTGRRLHSSAVGVRLGADDAVQLAVRRPARRAAAQRRARLGLGRPVAGLVIAGVACKEGLDAWRGQACCGPATCG